MRWSDLTVQLPADEYRRLLFAFNSGLHETRRAARVRYSDGSLDAFLLHLDAAIAWLVEVRATVGESMVEEP
jgi:hypothetical protein